MIFFINLGEAFNYVKLIDFLRVVIRLINPLNAINVPASSPTELQIHKSHLENQGCLCINCRSKEFDLYFAGVMEARCVHSSVIHNLVADLEESLKAACFVLAPRQRLRPFCANLLEHRDARTTLKTIRPCYHST